MARYIDEALVNARLKEICDDYATSYGKKYGGRAEMFARLTEDIPTADVVEVRHGRWIINDEDYWTKCSVCEFEYLDEQEHIYNTYRYCPHCGAKMDKGVTK